MANSDPFFEEKVKKSFENVKDDINLLKKELKELKDIFNEIKTKLTISIEKEPKKSSNLQKKVDLNVFKPSISKGNGGVKSNEQRATTSSNDEQSRAIVSEIPEDFRQAFQTLIYKFQNTTDREFSVFLTLYELGLNQETVTLFDIDQ